MRARQFIIEYDRAKTARAFSAKLVNQTIKDPTAPAAVKQTIKDMEPQQAAEMILQKQIEPGDPTKQKKFAQALALKYANGLIKWEDVTSTLTDYLAKFFKLGLKKKLKPEHSDFNRYKDLKTFYDAVDTYPDPDEEDQKKQAEKEASKGDAKLYYEDSTIRVIVPEDEAAACYYGQGTRWCTAASKGASMFNTYNREGPLYIILPKNPRYTGEKYQFHFESKSYMNEKDESASLSQLGATYPSIKKAFADQIKKFHVVSLMTDEEIKAKYPRALEIVKNNAIETKGSVVVISIGNFHNPKPTYKDADGETIEYNTFHNNVEAVTLSDIDSSFAQLDSPWDGFLENHEENLVVLDTKNPKKATVISIYRESNSDPTLLYDFANADGGPFSPASAAQEDMVWKYINNRSGTISSKIGDDVIKQQWKVVTDMVESAVELMIKQQAESDQEYRQYARDNGYNNLEDFDSELPYTEFNSYAEQLEILTQEVADTPLDDIKQEIDDWEGRLPEAYADILSTAFADKFKPGEGEDQPTSMPVEKLVDAVGKIKDNGSLDKDYEIDDTSFDPTDLTQESKKLGKKL